jgi:hypothetical protein
MLLIDHRVRKENFSFQVFQVLLIEVKSSLEGTIGDPPLAFEQVDNLGENLIEGHGVNLRAAGVSSLTMAKMTYFLPERKGALRSNSLTDKWKDKQHTIRTYTHGEMGCSFIGSHSFP